LFPEPGGAPRDHARLLELLAARLGAENVLVPAPAADHRPEQAARWAPLDPRRAGARAEATPGALPRPAWLLDAPIPLAVRGHRPFHGTPLRLVSPAERLDCGWQDGGPVVRDYFVAEDEAGACYWIFRSAGSGAEKGSDAGPTLQWYLHGLFA
jgi:protein ImuB